MHGNSQYNKINIYLKILIILVLNSLVTIKSLKYNFKIFVLIIIAKLNTLSI